MIRLLLCTLSILGLAGVSVEAHAQANSPVKVGAIYNHIYAPGGFDSNDHVQVVGEGLFRNTCYRPAETQVKVDEANHRIWVGPAAYEYSGFCLQVILPFNRVIDVGILSPGAWEIVQGPQADKLGAITIRKAITDSPDDFLYAPISQAFFQQKAASAEVLIAGEFPNSCMTLDDVKVTIEPDVLVLQPIAAAKSGAGCHDGAFPFSRTVPIRFLPKGRYLLHVRSMNSNAINTLVEMK